MIASSAAFTSSGQLCCASTVSHTVMDLAEDALLVSPALSSFLSDPQAAMPAIMVATPIAAMSLRFTPPSSGCPKLPPPPEIPAAARHVCSRVLLVGLGLGH